MLRRNETPRQNGETPFSAAISGNLARAEAGTSNKGTGAEMQNYCKGTLIVLASALIFSSSAMAQTAQPQGGGAAQNTLYYKLKDGGPGGPSPRRELTGSWAGPIAIDTASVAPPLTPLGQQLMSANKPEPKFHIADTNDSFARVCDPLGFPRNMIFEIRGITFATMPDRIIVLNQYQRAWREVWMDGRELPKNVGGTGKDAPDPRYYGYSVGHWESDNTLVVDTTGLDDKTWVTRMGYPHSVEAHVQERYTRSSHNDLRLTITLEDAKIYTKPFVLGTADFRWVPNQQLEEQLCKPSEMLQYLSLIGDPAGKGVPASK